MFKPAIYVSVWDGGTKIETSCEFNPETKEVKNIESTDNVEDLDILDEEYISFEGEDIKDFYDLDNDIGHGSFEE